MLIRKLRLDKGLSQEQLSEATHLSLRTIQRVEAGHRVSYASLRAIATTFHLNVDSLERELYAMQTSNDDFIEQPLWVRLVLGLPILSSLERPELIRHETGLVTYAVFAFAFSFLVKRVEFVFLGLTTTDALHFSAFAALFVAYIASITGRLRERLETAKVGATEAGQVLHP